MSLVRFKRRKEELVEKKREEKSSLNHEDFLPKENERSLCDWKFVSQKQRGAAQKNFCFLERSRSIYFRSKLYDPQKLPRSENLSPLPHLGSPKERPGRRGLN